MLVKLTPAGIGGASSAPGRQSGSLCQGASKKKQLDIKLQGMGHSKADYLLLTRFGVEPSVSN